jgi:DNA-binding IclR family transcriptional regulator
MTDDLISLSAPVFDAQGRIAAALNVGAPANRAPDSRHAEMGAMVQDTARRISEAVGYRA